MGLPNFGGQSPFNEKLNHWKIKWYAIHILVYVSSDEILILLKGEQHAYIETTMVWEYTG